jgi:hypothetical protein
LGTFRVGIVVFVAPASPFPNVEGSFEAEEISFVAATESRITFRLTSLSFLFAGWEAGTTSKLVASRLEPFLYTG